MNPERDNPSEQITHIHPVTVQLILTSKTALFRVALVLIQVHGQLYMDSARHH
jgi:hypothetical protein